MEGIRPALGGGDNGPLVGGVGSGRAALASLVLWIPRPTEPPLTGYVGRKPASIIAAFSSSCVGSVIGDLARGGFPVAFVGEGRSHNAAAFLTDTAESLLLALLDSRSSAFLLGVLGSTGPAL